MKFTDRKTLINKIKFLTKIHKEKTERYRKQYGVSEDIAFLTKESVMLASLVFEMRYHNITEKELNEDIE